VESDLVWRDRRLKYYPVDGIRLWLYDIVRPDEPFNVSYWKECADLVISDISARSKLPIVVGGTGLYLKSLSQSLSQISIPPNLDLRLKLSKLSPESLFNYLNRLDPVAADRKNNSDRHNPRRLLRAIEIARTHLLPSPRLGARVGGEFSPHLEAGEEYIPLRLGLTASREYLDSNIDRRVEARFKSGAREEAVSLMQKYSPDLSSMTASGYKAFLKNGVIDRWKNLEHQYARRQLTWFKKQPDIFWFDISRTDWRIRAFETIGDWYDKLKT